MAQGYPDKFNLGIGEVAVVRLQYDRPMVRNNRWGKDFLFTLIDVWIPKDLTTKGIEETIETINRGLAPKVFNWTPSSTMVRMWNHRDLRAGDTFIIKKCRLDPKQTEEGEVYKSDIPYFEVQFLTGRHEGQTDESYRYTDLPQDGPRDEDGRLSLTPEEIRDSLFKPDADVQQLLKESIDHALKIATSPDFADIKGDQFNFIMAIARHVYYESLKKRQTDFNI